MIDAPSWVNGVLARLQEAFGPRLAYLGLQGSYRRGEATDGSDIDLVVLLDTVELDDLDTYRAIVRAMPEGEKACGFMSGIDEFTRWPRHELFPFKMDTADYYGALDDFLPPVREEHIRENARTGASVLYHLLTHSYLYADAAAKLTVLKDAYKSAYFLMQVTHYLASGTYCTSKAEMLVHAEGTEKDILMAGRNFSAWLETRSEREAYGLLRDWCRGILALYPGE